MSVLVLVKCHQEFIVLYLFDLKLLTPAGLIGSVHSNLSLKISNKFSRTLRLIELPKDIGLPALEVFNNLDELLVLGNHDIILVSELVVFIEELVEHTNNFIVGSALSCVVLTNMGNEVTLDLLVHFFTKSRTRGHGFLDSLAQETINIT